MLNVILSCLAAIIILGLGTVLASIIKAIKISTGGLDNYKKIMVQIYGVTATGIFACIIIMINEALKVL